LLQGPEKQLNLPSLLIHRRDRSRSQLPVAGQKHKYPIVFFIVKLDAPEVCIDARLGQFIEKDHLIGDSDEGDRGSGLMVISVPGSM
jgi:hypothetical protein